jgi:hypothetical protein
MRRRPTSLPFVVAIISRKGRIVVIFLVGRSMRRGGRVRRRRRRRTILVLTGPIALFVVRIFVVRSRRMRRIAVAMISRRRRTRSIGIVLSEFPIGIVAVIFVVGLSPRRRGWIVFVVIAIGAGRRSLVAVIVIIGFVGGRRRIIVIKIAEGGGSSRGGWLFFRGRLAHR